MKYRTIYFTDGKLRFLDQTKLPHEIIYIECKSHYDVYTSIKCMQVRGAPAIGIAAAYGMAMAANNLTMMNGNDCRTWDDFIQEFERAGEYLKGARPTAVNLAWAVDGMIARIKNLKDAGHPFYLSDLQDLLLREATRIYEEDRKSCAMIGKFGEAFIKDGMKILTHCNAGALAASEMGTALAPIYTAHQGGKKIEVYVDETRPLLQGSRLTAWELKESGLDPILICDSMAAHMMKTKSIHMVIVGADRIAKNGDVANKIGTYGLAIAAKYHNIPFYVAAPISTLDLETKTGDNITIEQRSSTEVTEFAGTRVAAHGVFAYNPSFDVTPHDLITAIITDRGNIMPVTEEMIERMLAF